MAKNTKKAEIQPYQFDYNNSILQNILSRLLRFITDLRFLIYIFIGCILLGILWSYDPQDPGWFQTAPTAHVVNYFGISGAYIGQSFFFLFGWSSYLFVVFILRRAYCNYRRFISPLLSRDFDEHVYKIHFIQQLIGFVLLLSASMGIDALQNADWESKYPVGAGGLLGRYWIAFIFRVIGPYGVLVLLSCCLVVGLSLLFNFSWINLAERIGASLCWLWDKLYALYQKKNPIDAVKEQVNPVKKTTFVELENIHSTPPAPAESELILKKPNPIQQVQFAFENTMPSVDLLDPAPENPDTISEQTTSYYSGLIKQKLSEYKIDVDVMSVQIGPVVVRYDVKLGEGVKGSEVVSISNDLARSLSVRSIRVVETIEGTDLMGLEVPNQVRQTVYISEIIRSAEFQHAKSPLTMVLGKDTVGNAAIFDLMEMPHILVAGSTGSGKSVGVNCMLMSILFKARPDEVKLILIDPKQLEMAMYEDIPHLLCPVITDMTKVIGPLTWCVQEMERRYSLMNALKVRKINSFNQKIKEAAERGEPIVNPFSIHDGVTEPKEPLEPLPYIVIVIDEYADLIMSQGNEIEKLLIRLAQKARAAGIHIVLATQRPSANVVTSLIKANFPARIAFTVSSSMDSRVILDHTGAEKLLGKGDMMFLGNGQVARRLHGAFVSDDEVQRVVESVKESFGEAQYNDEVLDGGRSASEQVGEGGRGSFRAEKDPLYDEAVRIILESKRASVSYLQRRMSIGYNRAANLIEFMEQEGIVSAPLPNKATRDILVPTIEVNDEEI